MIRQSGIETEGCIAEGSIAFARWPPSMGRFSPLIRAAHRLTFRISVEQNLIFHLFSRSNHSHLFSRWVFQNKHRGGGGRIVLPYV